MVSLLAHLKIIIILNFTFCDGSHHFFLFEYGVAFQTSKPLRKVTGGPIAHLLLTRLRSQIVTCLQVLEAVAPLL